MRANFAASSDRLVVVETKRSSLKQKVNEMEEYLRTERAQSESMLERCREMLFEKDRECMDLHNRLDERAKELEDDVQLETEGLKAAIEGLKAALADEKRQNKAIETHVRSSEQCVLELKENITLLEERCTSLQSTILRLESEADSWRPNLRLLQASLLESESLCTTAKADVSFLRREVMLLKEELADADHRNAQLSEELKHAAVSTLTDFTPTARLHLQVRRLRFHGAQAAYCMFSDSWRKYKISCRHTSESVGI
jgi:chromosome segregation ATPase